MGLASDSDDFYSFRFGADGIEEGVSTGFIAGETLIWIGAGIMGATLLGLAILVSILRSTFARRESLSDKLR